MANMTDAKKVVDTAKVFFTADTHFDHENIIKFCKRPFTNSREMNAGLIARWNAAVPPDATVYHMGDFAFKSTWESVQEIRRQLNGSIVLVQGNHEEAALECEKRFPGTFQEVTLYKELAFGKNKIVLFHYGLRTWHHDLRGTWHLYGHSHGGLDPYGKSFDVGVDCQDFAPISFARLEEKMSYRPIGTHPKFQNYTLEVAT